MSHYPEVSTVIRLLASRLFFAWCAMGKGVMMGLGGDARVVKRGSVYAHIQDRRGFENILSEPYPAAYGRRGIPALQPWAVNGWPSPWAFSNSY